MKKPIFIAEIKTQSPYGFKSDSSFIDLAHIAIEHGDWISVHTGSLFGGDMQAISLVRNMTDKPILAKGFHTDIQVAEAIDRGADYVLMIDSFPQWDIVETKVITELTSIKDLSISQLNLYKSTGRKIIWNTRDLKTGGIKMENGLNLLLDIGVWTCQASNISNPKHIVQGVDAFIVGEHLPQFCSQL